MEKAERVDRIAGNNMGAEAGSAVDTAKRTLTWSECGIEEKVERLRVEVMDRRGFIDAGYALARKAWQMVSRHQHANDGRVLVDADARGDDFGGDLLAKGRLFDLLR